MTRARGVGSVFRVSYKDRHGEKKQTNTWWYSHPCRCCPRQKHREGGFASKGEARAALNVRLGEIAKGRRRFLGDKHTLQQLLDYVTTDYTVNEYAGLSHLAPRMRCLTAYFGAEEKVVDLTPDRFMTYITHRREQGAANATINHELGLLRRGFKLAVQLQKLDARPWVPRLKPAPPRAGVIDRDQLELILGKLDPDLRPLFEAAYITGWRCKSELTTRQWRHVDWGAAAWRCACDILRGDTVCADCHRYRPGWLLLLPGEAKNDDARRYPLIPSLRALLEEQRRRTDTLEGITGQVIPWVFWRAGGSGVHQAGAPIRSYHRAWSEACAAVGLAGKYVHDFRRTAVTRMEELGVARTTGKRLSGHRTDAVYENYSVTQAEAMLRAGATIENYLEEQTAAPKRVIHGSFRAADAKTSRAKKSR